MDSTIGLRKPTLEAIRDHHEMLRDGHPVERRGKVVDRPGLGIQSQRRVHACLHRAPNDAVEAGHLDHNPAWRAAKNLKAEPHEIEAGVAVSTVSKRLGHANPNITLGVYTHQLRDSRGKAARAVADLVRKVAN